MSSTVVHAYGNATFTVSASDKLAVFSKQPVQIYQRVGYPQIPSSWDLLTTTDANEAYVSSAFSADTEVSIQPSGADAYYETGTAPTVAEVSNRWATNGAPNALNATGTLTAAMLLGGIVTSTTAAAVTATLDTGAIMDAAANFDIGDKIVWSVINTGGANAFTVTASTGHTVVGAGAVANTTSGLFETRKTAADTFVTYRIS